jgi:hypothetical protein
MFLDIFLVDWVEVEVHHKYSVDDSSPWFPLLAHKNRRVTSAGGL